MKETERLIRAIVALGAIEEVLRANIFGLGVLARKEQLPHLRKKLRTARIVLGNGRTSPDAVLVEQHLLIADSAENHAPDAPIADGNRGLPISGGGCIPERRFAERAAGRDAHERNKNNYAEGKDFIHAKGQVKQCAHSHTSSPFG